MSASISAKPVPVVPQCGPGTSGLCRVGRSARRSGRANLSWSVRSVSRSRVAQQGEHARARERRTPRPTDGLGAGPRVGRPRPTPEATGWAVNRQATVAVLDARQHRRRRRSAPRPPSCAMSGYPGEGPRASGPGSRSTRSALSRPAGGQHHAPGAVVGGQRDGPTSEVVALPGSCGATAGCSPRCAEAEMPGRSRTKPQSARLLHRAAVRRPPAATSRAPIGGHPQSHDQVRGDRGTVLGEHAGHPGHAARGPSVVMRPVNRERPRRMLTTRRLSAAADRAAFKLPGGRAVHGFRTARPPSRIGPPPAPAGSAATHRSGAARRRLSQRVPGLRAVPPAAGSTSGAA